MEKIILASNSPRRKMLLEQFNINFEVISEEIDEELYLSTIPIEIAKELSKLKADVINLKYKDRIIIAADTIVVFNNIILGKPKNKENAREMIQMLSGNIHEVITGCTIINHGEVNSFTEVTKVKFYELTLDEVNEYLEYNDFIDKAGSYGIQGAGGMLVEWIQGDYYNVVGLPISKVIRKLKKISRGT